MSSDLILNVESLSKTYRVFGKPHHRLLQALSNRVGLDRKFCFEVEAVKEVSFRLERGQSVSIIGRNGSGKSTLLEMIVGTLQPSSGSVELSGRVSALLELGAGFNPDFTGRENFRMAASIHGLSSGEIREIEDEVERFADIGPFIDEPVRTYSSGMYVRLAFASAVHVEPDLLIVDEALAVGDVFFQQKCFDFIDRRMKNTSKLLVTHDLASAVRLADFCIVMDKGRVIFEGEPLEAIETYTASNLRSRVEHRIEGLSKTQDSNAIEGWSTGVDPGEICGESTADELLKVRALEVRVGSGEVMAKPPDSVVVHHGQVVELRMILELGAFVDDPIIGYLVRDRLGIALFGQNTAGCNIDLTEIREGRRQLKLTFVWPEVEQGEYTLTVGLGSGRHSLHHEIVAWVQGLVQFTCVPRREVHGLFNNDLTVVELS